MLGFLILGSAYFAVLLLQMAFVFLAGFSQIILIVFLAWLLAFIMSPVARFLDERLPISRPMAVVPYLLALVLLGFVMFVAGGAISGEVSQITTEFPRTATQIEDTLTGYEEALGLEPGTLVELFRTAQVQVGDAPGRSSTRPRRSHEPRSPPSARWC